MFNSNWNAVSYLYIWPESERLTANIQKNAKNVYTTPVLKSEDMLKDEVAEAVEQLHAQPSRYVEPGMDKAALKTLIKEKRLKGAFNLTTKILMHMGHGMNTQGNRKCVTFKLMEIWNCRFQLLMALKMHTLAIEEMVAFDELDAPDLYLQYHWDYRQHCLTGTLVPFKMRLIHAEISKYSGDMSQCYKRLVDLERKINLITETFSLTPEQKSVWQKRFESVELAKARLLYTLNDEQSLVSLYRRISTQTTDLNKRREIQKMLAKLASIWGNSQLMDAFCNEATESADDFCRSLRLVFFGKYQEAVDSSTKALTVSDQNAVCNNNAVCLLYLSQVKESVNQLLNHPNIPVLPLILNLFTVAELSSTNTAELRAQHFIKFSQHFCDLLEPRTLRIIK